jgi:predicted nucleic acid-binding protein
MAVKRFFDTNVLLYGYDMDAPEKRNIALGLIEQAWSDLDGVAISVQVLQEFFVNFVRRGYSPAEAAALTSDFGRWPVIDNSHSVFKLGVALQSRWQISLWDAMILAAAHSSGSRELLTEDLNHGQDYGGVTAVNPFLLSIPEL